MSFPVRGRMPGPGYHGNRIPGAHGARSYRFMQIKREMSN